MEAEEIARKIEEEKKARGEAEEEIVRQAEEDRKAREEAEEEIVRQAGEDRKVREQQEAVARKAQERCNTLEEKSKAKAADKKPKG